MYYIQERGSDMADSKELKPKSFRIDEETSEKFKEIATSIGGSQQETLAKLIEAYEFQQGKAILTEKKTDIEQFEKYVGCLVRMYMGVLEDNQNTTELVRTEFEALLQSKDMTIQDLQKQLTLARELKQEAVKQEEKCKAQTQELQQALNRLTEEFNSKMNDLQNMLQDKDNLNKALTSSCNDLKVQVEQMKADAEQSKELKEQNSSLQAEVNRLNALCTSVVEQEQFKHEKALLEIEKKYQNQIQALKEEKQVEIDKYQSKYMELLESTKKITKTKKVNE